FVKGQVVKTVPEAQIVETLIEEALRIADEMGAELPEELRGLMAGPTVTVH
ncbi:4-hydroxy-3-methylbut-2-en-1-yl diphosphate synthase, partial [Micromonospora sp. NPDC048835]